MLQISNLTPSTFLRQLGREGAAFKFLCLYLVFEYARPQSIIPALAGVPWAQICLVSSILLAPLDSKSRWSTTTATWLMVAYGVAVLAASLGAQYPDESFPHLIDFYGWLVIYFIFTSLVVTRERYIICICIFLLCSFKLSFGLAKIWALRGFAYTSWGLTGPPGYFQNSGELAIQMLVYLPVAVAFLAGKRPYISRFGKIVLMLMPITAGLTIIGSSSRGGQIAFAVQILLFLHMKKLLRPKHLVLIAIFASLAISLLPREQLDRFSSIGDDKTSQQRILYWKHGIDMISERPLLGVGYFNFSRYYAEHYPEDMLYEKAELPHNIFIQIATDCGFVGLVVFSCMVIYSFRVYRSAQLIEESNSSDIRYLKMHAVALKYALIGYLVAGQFVTVTYYPFFWINLAFTTSLSLLLRKGGLDSAPAT